MARFKWPTFRREIGPWPFPDDISKTICLFVGREASAALHIALGKHSGAAAAQQVIYHEPFTFWDWHDIHPDDTYARDWKRQRFWEHRRGFVGPETQAHGYLTSRERWETFQDGMEKNAVRGEWVKRIAVAHWMGLEDFIWIAENLQSLEELDLSDIPSVCKETQHPWNALIYPDRINRDQKRTKCIADLYEQLTWLGVPDFRNSRTGFARNLVESTLPRCHGLRTLSIRAQRLHNDVLDPHDYVRILPDLVAEQISKSVTTLELRLPFPFLDELRDALKKNGSNITNIGIDLGAWIQQLPKQTTAAHVLSEQEVKETARSAARKRRFETYKAAHTESLGADSGWLLPKTTFDQELHRLTTATPEHVNAFTDDRSFFGAGRHAFETNFYVDNDTPNRPNVFSTTGHFQTATLPRPQDEIDRRAEIFKYPEHVSPRTLPMMLNHLHKMASEYSDFNLFALEPEWQTRSTRPIHPLALLQRSPSETSSKDIGTTLQPKVYEWLNTTFNWRPVFDWDWFMKFEDETSQNNLTSAREELLQQWGLPTPYSQQKLLSDIAKQFTAMKSAGIPIHILIGRRHPDSSSLYWGWPHDETTWKAWLEAPFDSNLQTIAPFVDTLSIFYDMRNPLPETSLTPNHDTAEPKTCPRPICPWNEVNQQCPFPQQWSHVTSTTTTRKQKMANKRHLGATPALAPNSPYLPPTGHLAQEYDPLADESPREVAAFDREAVAWQRFWNTYAYTFTALTELNVRMPRRFDKVGSMKLARLLDPEKGWGMRAFADESAEFGGAFVRRTWVRKEGGELEMKEDEEVEKGEAEQLGMAVERSVASAKANSAVDGEIAEPPYRLVRLAQRTWQTRMREYIEELRTHARGERGDVLASTIRALEFQLQDYRPEEVFDGSGGLVRHARNYVAEEDEKRKSPAPTVDALQGWGSDGDDVELYDDPLEAQKQREVAFPGTGNVDGEDSTDLDAELFGSDLPDVLPLPGIEDTALYGAALSGLSHVPSSGVKTVSHQDVPPSAQLKDLLATLEQYGTPAEPIVLLSNLDDILTTLQTNGSQALGVEANATRWEHTIIQDGEMLQAVESVEHVYTEYVPVRADGVGAHAPETPSGLRESATPVAENSPAQEVTPPPEVVSLRTTPLSEQSTSRETATPRETALPTEPTPSRIPRQNSGYATRESKPTREAAPPPEAAPSRKRTTLQGPTLPVKPRPSKKPKTASGSDLKQAASARQSKPANKSTSNEQPPPADQPTTPQQQPQVETASPPKNGKPVKPQKPAKGTPPFRKTPVQKQQPEPEPVEKTPEPLSPPPPPSPPSSPPPPSSLPPPKPTPKSRRRRDPVLADAIDTPELSAGRRLRSSRSATPTVSYRETSDEVGDEKGKRKGRGRKRKADEDYGDEGEAGGGGIGGKGKKGRARARARGRGKKRA